MKAALALALLLAVAAPMLARAQNVGPRVGFVYPAGGRPGTTFVATLGGQFLDGVTNVFVSGGGVRGTVLEHTKPLTPQQFNNLREQFRALQEKRAASARSWRRRQGGGASTNAVWTAADEKSIAAIRQKLAAYQRRPQNPAIAETVKVRLTVDADAGFDGREIRLVTPLGLSNPLKFCVGQYPEFFKKLPAATNDAAPFRRGPRSDNEQTAVKPVETSITIPATVNGQVLQGGVDRYRFRARKGQHLVIAVSARDLIPYLADAVPGWFQATLALYDAKGKEVAFDDDYQFRPDPVIHYGVPADGEYVAEIRDAIYRGREDFVYRVSIGETPFITSIFPLGGRVGETVKVAVEGWNLGEKEISMDGRDASAGTTWLSARKDKLVSNRVPFQLDTLPEVTEQEPNDSAQAAQAVTLPVIVNGRIGSRGDSDVFRFEGTAGAQVVAEVYARRLDSPLDSLVRITDTAGRELAVNDDHEDKASGLNTHHADSWLSLVLPANGTYYAHLSDAQHNGGADFAYRLRLSAPRPDFELRVVPASVSARAGLSAPLTVFALRKDGFTNEILVSLKDAPAGFAVSGGRIAPGQDKAQLTLAPPLRPSAEPYRVRLQGRAKAGALDIVHEAVPAEDMMQAFAYRHLVPANELDIAVSGNWMARGARITAAGPVKLTPGGASTVRISGPPMMFSDRVRLELRDAPEGVTLEKVSPRDDGGELVFRCDGGKAKPGAKGNLIVEVLAGRNPRAAKQPAQANQRRAVVGALPAIPFEIGSD